MKDYNRFITALKRTTLSKPMRELFSRGLLKGKIIDIGCGHGFDVKTLSELDMDIVGYDKYNVEFNDTELIQKRYDVVTCNYMFNVIPDLEEHNGMIKLLRSLSDNVYIAVRSDVRAIKNNWVFDERNLSYWTGKSYQRFYNDILIRKLFGKIEYIVKNNSFILFKLKGYDNNA